MKEFSIPPTRDRRRRQQLTHLSKHISSKVRVRIGVRQAQILSQQSRWVVQMISHIGHWRRWGSNQTLFNEYFMSCHASLDSPFLWLELLLLFTIMALLLLMMLLFIAVWLLVELSALSESESLSSSFESLEDDELSSPI